MGLAEAGALAVAGAEELFSRAADKVVSQGRRLAKAAPKAVAKRGRRSM